MKGDKNFEEGAPKEEELNRTTMATTKREQKEPTTLNKWKPS